MDLVEVEITSMAITARYGALASGTILRTDKDYAQHLVEDCGAAKYVTAKETKPQQPPVVTTPAAPRKRADTKAAKPPEKAVDKPGEGDAATPPAGQANPDASAQDGATQGTGDASGSAEDKQTSDPAAGTP